MRIFVGLFCRYVYLYYYVWEGISRCWSPFVTSKILKVECLFRKLFCLSPPRAIWVFPLACKVPAILIWLWRPQEKMRGQASFSLGSHHNETVLGSQTMLLRRHSIQPEIGRMEKNLHLTWHPSQDQKNVFFFLFNWLSTPLSSPISFSGLEHVLFKIIHLKDSYNPER